MAARYLLTSERIRRDLDTLAADYEPIRCALAQLGYPIARQKNADFGALARIIIGQQVSVRVADVITDRVSAVLDGEWHATAVSRVSDDALRSAGLSRQKIRYLRSLTDAVLDNRLPFAHWHNWDDEQILARITDITGFGVWSAQMFLLFSLGRVDVWPAGDLAVRVGYAQLFGGEPKPSEHWIRQQGAAFAPRRSALALLCWSVYGSPYQR